MYDGNYSLGDMEIPGTPATPKSGGPASSVLPESSQKDRLQRARADLVLSVPFEELTFRKVLGSGSFKTVHEALWNQNLVAVCEVTQEMISHEVAIMSSLSRHPNLVQIFGIAHNEKNGKKFLVMELLSHGSLIRVLHKRADELTLEKKMVLAGQICDGMVALAASSIVHADLACRNVMVQSMDPLMVKVGDFGLSKMSTLYYAENNELIPYRWSAPEVILKGKYSEQSDVWAFGVTLWEIYTGGEIPFGLVLKNQDVVKLVLAGGTLERPSTGMPEPIWEIIKSCFAFHEAQRPTFKHLQGMFRGYRGVGSAAFLQRRSSGEIPASGSQATQSFNWPSTIPPGYETSHGAVQGTSSTGGKSTNQIKRTSSEDRPTAPDHTMMTEGTFSTADERLPAAPKPSMVTTLERREAAEAPDRLPSASVFPPLVGGPRRHSDLVGGPVGGAAAVAFASMEDEASLSPLFPKP
mmetsp:Transcript_37794/g.119229  ORF Transcript_37794/g.119229 Transcript_37794/m.119229 type:complete len:467 (+) Transcript_37794:306-1706(+)